MKILSVNKPGGDRGPAIGYMNHLKALSSCGFEIQELTQEIWNDEKSLRKFDVAWAYVRFHPQILERCKNLGLLFVGGPNIVMERADVGIVDEWEKWYLENSRVDVNVNVADYYTDHVRKFSRGNCKFKTLEYCYEMDLGKWIPSKKSVDVTVYVKDRINDGGISKIAEEYCSLLKRQGLKYQILTYGNYNRDDYIKACTNSRITAWFSIEDYCSLAQIESHYAGSAVIGTPYNLTIPINDDMLCRSSQDMTESWIKWRKSEEVSRDYFNTTLRVLSQDNLVNETIKSCKLRHGYDYYRQKVVNILSNE